MTPPEQSNASTPEQQRAASALSYADGVVKYLSDYSDETILRPHQLDVFKDLEKFFEAGETRGYINLPTGTGKTVLFVELSKALREAGHAEHRSRSNFGYSQDAGPRDMAVRGGYFFYVHMVVFSNERQTGELS